MATATLATPLHCVAKRAATTRSTTIKWSAARAGAGGKATIKAKAKHKKMKRKTKSFIIQPADGFEGHGGDGGWSLWQESEAGSVLIGTRRARRRQQQMSDHWRKIMALGGIDGGGGKRRASHLYAFFLFSYPTSTLKF